ncbi:MAG: hypothetical protein HUJ56_01085 [Erysipelotrichaceae bacterium]|nr:hypothetical protein [Erysipelotrichaceae bacterium]
MARIIIDLEVMCIHETYEIVTDNQMLTDQFYEKIIDDLQDKNVNLTMMKNTKIYSRKDQAELDMSRTLFENNVDSGDKLILV